MSLNKQFNPHLLVNVFLFCEMMLFNLLKANAYTYEMLTS